MPYVTNEKTAPAVVARIDAMLDAVAEAVTYLYGRWQDEKEYEDFAEYASRMTTMAGEHGATDVRATRRPFGFVFSMADSPAGARYAITCNASAIQWKRTA